jgi:hypothetical protein
MTDQLDSSESVSETAEIRERAIECLDHFGALLEAFQDEVEENSPAHRALAELLELMKGDDSSLSEVKIESRFVRDDEAKNIRKGSDPGVHLTLVFSDQEIHFNLFGGIRLITAPSDFKDTQAVSTNCNLHDQRTEGVVSEASQVNIHVYKRAEGQRKEVLAEAWLAIGPKGEDWVKLNCLKIGGRDKLAEKGGRIELDSELASYNAGVTRKCIAGLVEIRNGVVPKPG